MSTAIQTKSGTENPYIDSLQKQTTAPNTSTAAQEIQNRFLTMLVTELKNQDPLNPMDSKDMTAQLAQISTVQGIEKVNAALKGLAQGSFASRILDATRLIGHYVGYSAKGFHYDGAHNISGDVASPSTAKRVVVTITDKSGKVIRHITIEPPQKKNHVVWDGKDDDGKSVPPGDYDITAKTSIGDKSFDVPFIMKRKVKGISQDAEGIILLFDQGEGIHLGDVDSFEDSSIQQ